MKRALAVIVVFFLLFVFSSCKRSPTYEEMYESLQEEYFQVEDKYYEASERVDDLELLLNHMYGEYLTAYSYFDSDFSDTTKEEAYDAIMKIGELFSNAGY